MADGNSRDPNQDAADQVKQRGMDSTVDLAQEPAAQDGVQQKQGEVTPYSGDVRDTVNDDVEEASDQQP
jgi:hypothetical protein